MKVTQVLCAAGPVDAVTNQALAWRAQFARWGWHGEDYTAKARAEMRGAITIRPLKDLERPTESSCCTTPATPVGSSGCSRLAPRTLLLSHNVTPEECFWPYEPVEGVRCELGREQLAELVGDGRRARGRVATSTPQSCARLTAARPT